MNEHIKEIMENFKFDKLHKSMTLLGWTWHNVGIPSVSDLKKTAEDLLRKVANENVDGTIATGGFKATKDSEECFVLEFILEEYYSG